MAEFQSIFRESQRMCSTYDECHDGCPLYDDENRRCMYRVLATSGRETAAKIERIVMEWAEAHPEKTYPSWDDAWHSLFPNSKLHDSPCPRYFGEECPHFRCKGCKKRQISKEVAEKLGIKPVGGGDDV